MTIIAPQADVDPAGLVQRVMLLSGRTPDQASLVALAQGVGAALEERDRLWRSNEVLGGAMSLLALSVRRVLVATKALRFHADETGKVEIASGRESLDSAIEALSELENTFWRIGGGRMP